MLDALGVFERLGVRETDLVNDRVALRVFDDVLVTLMLFDTEIDREGVLVDDFVDAGVVLLDALDEIELAVEIEGDGNADIAIEGVADALMEAGKTALLAKVGMPGATDLSQERCADGRSKTVG